MLRKSGTSAKNVTFAHQNGTDFRYFDEQHEYFSHIRKHAVQVTVPPLGAMGCGCSTDIVVLRLFIQQGGFECGNVSGGHIRFDTKPQMDLGTSRTDDVDHPGSLCHSFGQRSLDGRVGLLPP